VHQTLQALKFYHQHTNQGHCDVSLSNLFIEFQPDSLGFQVLLMDFLHLKRLSEIAAIDAFEENKQFYKERNALKQKKNS